MKVIEQTARASYGKLLAILVKATSGDIALAEDCLSSAFAKALEVWPQTSAPENPEGWIVKTAKNLMLDKKRHQKVQDENVQTLLSLLAEQVEASNDNRLELLFACAHPAIDPTVRTPLMLQTVLGFNVDQIASVFLTSPSAIEKRLIRAKQKIKIAKIPFEIPDVGEMPGRLTDVLEGVYALFGKSWDEFNFDLEDEAIFLAEIVVKLLPAEAEPKGLLSLLLFCKSRQEARRREDTYIPLFQQDVKLWNQDLIGRAEKLLKEAFLLKSPGRFQFESAIQSAQIAKIQNGLDTDMHIVKLYEALIATTGTIGAVISYAAALLNMDRTAESFQIAQEIDGERVKVYQPYWALMGEIHSKQGDFNSAKHCLERAIGLTEDKAVKNYLRGRIKRLNPA